MLLFGLLFQVLYIQAFVFVFLFWKLVRKIFFGQLRQAEIEVKLLIFFIFGEKNFQFLKMLMTIL